MAQFDFPGAPNPGDVFTDPTSGASFTWNGYAWMGGAANSLGALIVSDTPPAAPANNSLWFESDTGMLFIRYNDGNSSQWVQVNALPNGAGYMPLRGVTDGSDAPAGQIGEVISSVVTTGVPLTVSLNFYNVTSISLTPGDWDVSGEVQFALTAIATTLDVAINNVSANPPVGVTASRTLMNLSFTAATQQLSVKTSRVSVAATTPYYLVARAGFASGTVSAAGAIWAREGTLMPFDFPNTPSVGDLFQDSSSGAVYRWNGYAWVGGVTGIGLQTVKETRYLTAGSFTHTRDPKNSSGLADIWVLGACGGRPALTSGTNIVCAGGGGTGAITIKWKYALGATGAVVVGSGVSGAAGQASSFDAITANGSAVGNAVATAPGTPNAVGGSNGGAAGATGDENYTGSTGAGALYTGAIGFTSQRSAIQLRGINRQGASGNVITSPMTGAPGDPGAVFVVEYLSP